MDGAPFASVLFVFIMLLLVQSSLVFTPGISVSLPETIDLPGSTNPKVVVTVDDTGHLYFENQVSDEPTLRDKLTAARQRTADPLTLLIQADRNTRYDVLVRLAMVARAAGINEVLLATRPKLVPVAAAQP